MKYYPNGEYNIYYWFYINDKHIGEKLTLRINIKEKNDNKNEIEDKIKEFKETFGFSEKDYSNELILKILKSNNFEFESSFIKLMNIKRKYELNK